MSGGCLTALVFAVLFAAGLVILIRWLVKAGQEQRRKFVHFAQGLGANAEPDPQGGASVRIVAEGRAFRVFMTESNRFKYANLEMAVGNAALTLEMHNARPFQQGEVLTGLPDFDAAFHIRSNNPAAVKRLFTEDVCSLLLQTPYEHDSHSAWDISKGRLHYRALPPVSQFSTGLEDPQFHDRFRTALRAAALLAQRIDNLA